MNVLPEMFNNPLLYAIAAVTQVFIVNIALVSLYYIFPFVKRLVVLLGFPLRTIHQFLHIFVWTYLQPERQYQIKSSNLQPQMELSLKLEKSSLSQIIQITLSPLIIGVPGAIILPMIFPNELVTLEEHLIYYYFLIIVAGVLWPDDEDYYVLYQAVMVKIAISFKVYVILLLSAIFGLILGIALDQPGPTQFLFAICSFFITLIYYSNNRHQPKIRALDYDGESYIPWNGVNTIKTQDKIISNKFIE